MHLYIMPFFDFLEIGTSDFDTEIEKSDNTRVGMSIEPIKYYLEVQRIYYAQI